MEPDDAVDFAHLAVVRSMNRSGVTEPLDRCEVLADLIERLVAMRDAQAALAVEVGATYAAVCPALGISRQAARLKLAREPVSSDA